LAEVAVSSNIAQNYPYSSESEAERASAVERALGAFEGLGERVAAESLPFPAQERKQRSWTWVCRADGGSGRLHAAGYAREAHAVFVVCDSCGKTFLR
jgi:hypothetical protein